MGAEDKRKAEAALEGGPAKKAAPGKLAVHPKRVRELRKGAVEGSGPVIYWCGLLREYACDGWRLAHLRGQPCPGGTCTTMPPLTCADQAMWVLQDVAGPARAGQLGAAVRRRGGRPARRACGRGLQPGACYFSLAVGVPVWVPVAVALNLAGVLTAGGCRSTAASPHCSAPSVFVSLYPSRSQVTEFLGAGARQFGFMVRGLQAMQPKLAALGIPFFLLKGAACFGLAGLIAQCISFLASQVLAAPCPPASPRSVPLALSPAAPPSLTLPRPSPCRPLPLPCRRPHGDAAQAGGGCGRLPAGH